MVIGTINIAAGIISTIQQFLKFRILMKLIVSVLFLDKFTENKVELSKSPEERQSVYEFLKNCTENLTV